MDLTISTICFLRLVTALLSLTEAIRNRPDVEQSSVGVCWTVAFFAFLISIALESKQPKLASKLSFNIFFGYMLGVCVLFVGILFSVRTPKTSDGIDGLPAHNIWTGFWCAGAIITLVAQMALLVQTKRIGFPLMLTVSYASGAMGSLLFSMAGILSATEFIDEDIFYFTAMYDWYMNSSNVWISASVFYILHAITLYFGLTAANDETIEDDTSGSSTADDDQPESALKNEEKA